MIDSFLEGLDIKFEMVCRKNLLQYHRNHVLSTSFLKNWEELLQLIKIIKVLTW